MVNYQLPKQYADADRLTKLNIIQDAAVESTDSSCYNSLEVATGVGKTFIAFKYLYHQSDTRGLHKDDEIWFLAETTTRLATLEEEATKFKKIYGKNPLKDFNIVFHCYQAQPKGKPRGIIADEIHESLTPKYSTVYDGAGEMLFILGLSATIPKNLKVYRDEEEDNDLRKGQLLQMIAPISFSYPSSQAIADGILSPFQTTVIKHSFNNSTKDIPCGTKKKPFMGTEASAYGYWQSVVMSHWAAKGYKGLCAKKMCRMLWNLNSKAEVIKALLPTLEGKTIIFGVELALLDKITDNVVRGGNKAQESKNAKLIADFNSGKINVIASSKKLKQGITLEGVTNCIIVSYYKQSWSMFQMIGRIIRFVPDKLANLFVMKTENSYETKWFEQMNKVLDENDKVIDTVDLNITKYVLSENLLLNGAKP